MGSPGQALKELGMLWRLFTWRHWRRAPLATTILIGILALGVGVFFSIRLANRAAVSGFSLFTETLNGESDLLVVSPAGRLSISSLRDIRDHLGELPVSLFPVVETTATALPSEDRDGFNAEQYHVVGVDLLSLPNLIFLNPSSYRPPVEVAASETTVESTWSLEDSDSHQLFITRQLAQREGLSLDDPLPLILNDQLLEFTIAGIIPETDFSARKPATLLLMDLPRLQQLLGQTDTIDRIELRIPSGPLYPTWLRDAEARLAAASSDLWSVEWPERQRQTGATMTQAFRLNLTILSGLALLVGVYLILQALEAAVIKRRAEIATLKSLGLSESTLLRGWMVESISLGVLGSLSGLLLGFAGAQWAVGAIARTVNSLYYSNTTQAAAWHWGEAGLALVIGILASALAGWLPARDAARTPPAQVLARGNQSQGLRLLARPGLGWICLGVGMILSLLPALPLEGGVHFPLAGYLTALLWVLGASIVGGSGFRPVARCLHWAFANTAVAAYAISHLRRPSGRHRLTGAGLLVAVGMAGGMSLLIQSFESTMVNWIQKALKADLYVAVQGVGNISSQNRLQPETWKAMATDPDVAEAEVGQMYPIEFREATTYLVGASFGMRSGWRSMVWIESPKIPFSELHHDETPCPAVVNESFQHRFGVAVNEEIRVPTPVGFKRLKIVGVFADYGNERGSIVLSRTRLATWYNEESALNLAAHLKPEVDPEAVRRRWMSQHPGLVVRTNRLLREEVMTVFHETFSVTHALKWIGVGVALVGLGLGLWSILLERKPELGVLKELGMNNRHIARSVMIEGVGLTLVGALTGILLSIAFGHLLIHVINYQSFGWTLAFEIPWRDFAQLMTGVLGVAAAVSYAVGHRGATLPSDREE